MMRKIIVAISSAILFSVPAQVAAGDNTEAYHACLAVCQEYGNTYGVCYLYCYDLHGMGDGERPGSPNPPPPPSICPSNHICQLD